jgi:hypothetical protein
MQQEKSKKRYDRISVGYAYGGVDDRASPTIPQKRYISSIAVFMSPA